MLQIRRIGARFWLIAIMTIASTTGCTTSPRQWWNNGLKVGPNYRTPGVVHATSWLDEGNESLITGIDTHQQWWDVFQDPVLSEVISAAYQQNLSLRAAFLRVEDARLQRAITAGNFFPQTQAGSASYSRQQAGTRFFDTWSTGLNLAWEVDLWGRLRRSIDAADANVEASQADANAILVVLIADVAATYIEIRSFDERIRMAQENVKIQDKSYGIAERKRTLLKAEIDEKQALSNLEDTRALIPALERQRRNAINRLAVLLGTTPDRMAEWVEGSGSLPVIPNEVFVGVPCDVIRQRPDIRVAERNLAIQAEQIGIAESDLYPRLTVSGSISVQSESLSNLFTQESTVASIGPAFQWNILNYGRIANNVLLQDNRFQQLLVQYRETALIAQQEVENGIVDFIKFREQMGHQEISAKASKRTVELGQKRYRAGKISYTSVFVYEADLVNKTDALIQTRANAALALINTYKAFGGGWQIRNREPYVCSSYVPSPLNECISADRSESGTSDEQALPSENSGVQETLEDAPVTTLENEA